MTMAEVVRERIRIPCEGEIVDAELAYPAEGEPETMVLLLAPHPHMGGRMDNNLVRHLAARAAEDGRVVLRFDYRGVGESTLRLPAGVSRYDHFDRMERELRYADLLPEAHAAFRALAEAAGPVRRRVLLGYSLGGVLAGMLAPSVEVTHLVAVSPPVARVGLAALRDLDLPKLLLGGDGDFAFDLERFAAEYPALPEPRGFLRLPGCDHFFRQEEERVYRALAPFLDGAPPRDGEA